MRDRTAMNSDQSPLCHAYHHKDDDKQAKSVDFSRLCVINRIEIIN